MRFGRSFSLGKIFGIEIRIDMSWIIIFLLVTWTFAFGYFPLITPNLPASQNIILGFITSLVFFGSVLVHELSHSVVARRNGLTVNIITLFVFGGASHLEDEPNTPWVEFKMAFAGPLSSLILGGVFYGFSAASISNIGIYAMFQVLALVNIILGIFNLLPGFPLDGGRVFRSIVWYFNRDYLKSTKIAMYGGKAVSVALMIWGIVSFASNFILGGVWLILIGAFLYSLAGISYRQAEAKEKLLHLKVNELINKDYVMVEPKTSLLNTFDIFIRERTDTIFTGENRKVFGFLKLNEVEEVGPDKMEKEKASLLEHPLKSEEILRPEDDALKAVKFMQREDISCLPVEKDNRIEGMVCKQEIFAALKTR